jgi:hypothetical protein
MGRDGDVFRPEINAAFGCLEQIEKALKVEYDHIIGNTNRI